VKGVVVDKVPDGSPVADAGLQRGDVIEQVNQQPVNSVADYEHSLPAELSPKGNVLKKELLRPQP